MRAILGLVLAVRAGAACTPSDNTFCMEVDIFASETGLYKFEGHDGHSPDLEVKIGQSYTFDQTHVSNWYHAVGFAYYPDGAHGETWGGDERDEVETLGELLYKIDGENTTCPDAGDTGLDCYEPEFFHPRAVWKQKKYTAVLTITQAMADTSHGGVIYYFCHIHSKMSGKLIIKNADGSAVTQADGSALPNPDELTLYPVPTRSAFDILCGTFGAAMYAPEADMACSQNFLPGTLDTDFEKCFQAIDCQMNKEMRVIGHDEHNSEISTFMQQMIPHHTNAVNMAKMLLKFVPEGIADVDLLEDILWSIVNIQNYEIHTMRNWLAGDSAYTAVMYDGNALTATSLGEHCGPELDGADLTIAASSPSSAEAEPIAGCTASDTNICIKVNHFIGEAGKWEVDGLTGTNPDIIVKIGQTYTFDQRDPSNWVHPLGFRFREKGAKVWKDIKYMADGAVESCPHTSETGHDCRQEEFLYPWGDWSAKHYTTELTITQEMADQSDSGVLWYYCSFHNEMRGRLLVQKADGTALYSVSSKSEDDAAASVDTTCGTYGVAPYAGGGAKVCDERFLCGTLDTTFEKCMQAIDCKMKVDMKDATLPDREDKIEVFMQQMVGHHVNAVNMARILLKEEGASGMDSAMEDGNAFLMGIINFQNWHIYRFDKYIDEHADEKDASGTEALHVFLAILVAMIAPVLQM